MKDTQLQILEKEYRFQIIRAHIAVLEVECYFNQFGYMPPASLTHMRIARRRWAQAEKVLSKIMVLYERMRW
jgi:hypothetical protein